MIWIAIGICINAVILLVNAMWSRALANERRLLLRAKRADNEASEEVAFRRAMADACDLTPQLKLAEDGR